VNVLLLYNVFRVLEPAFDGGSLSSGRHSQDEEFASKPLEVNPFEESKRASWDVVMKSDLLAFPSRSPTTSSNAFVQVHNHGRAPSYDMTADPIAQPIMSREVMTQNAFNTPRRPDPAMTAARTAPEGGLKSLQIPPRRKTPSPIGVTSRDHMGHRSNSSGGSSSSQASGDLDVTGWLAQQNADGSMPRRVRSPPLLSAVRPTFAEHHGDPRPAPGLRPLRLSGSSYSSASSPVRDARFGTGPRGSPRPF
jgi:hypothetical protein